MSKPKILVIYTGGTIGMIQDETTGSLKPFDFHNIYDQIPRLAFYKIDIDTYSFQKPIDSSDMNPLFWKDIADKIIENYHLYDGFVVLHGTDTMGYSASALSFMFKNLSKPIIFTGSQLPLGIARTDGRNNIINAIEMAAAKDENGQAMVPEVTICFENQLYRGNRTHKNNAEDFNAFASPNYPMLARIGVDIKYYKENIYVPNGQPTDICTDMDTNIAILKLFPGINEATVSAILNIEGLKGVVMETYGSGNASQSQWFTDELQKAVNKGIIIMDVTQCKGGGSVNIGKYESSLHLGKLGIVSGYDIITETAITKMMHLFGTETDNEKIKYLLSKSLRGEMTVE
jgi:L-asparaginase